VFAKCLDGFGDRADLNKIDADAQAGQRGKLCDVIHCDLGFGAFES
jgi:hypothetical protein